LCASDLDISLMTASGDYRAALLTARRAALAGAHPTLVVQARLAAARAARTPVVAAA
jgi:hypothetical protein